MKAIANIDSKAKGQPKKSRSLGVTEAGAVFRELHRSSTRAVTGLKHASLKYSRSNCMEFVPKDWGKQATCSWAVFFSDLRWMLPFSRVG